MARRRELPTLAAVWDDGPALRVADVAALTTLSPDTIRTDIAAGELVATMRKPGAPFLISRENARAYLTKLGLAPGGVTTTALKRLSDGQEHLVPLGSVGFGGNPQPTVYRDPSALLHALLQLMGFGSLVRNAVATAHAITGGSDGLQASVQHAAWTGKDGYDKPTYAAATTLTAIVEDVQKPIRTESGETVLSTSKLTILVPPAANGASGRLGPIDARDKFTLPNGRVCKVLAVEGVIDTTTNKPFMHEVWLA